MTHHAVRTDRFIGAVACVLILGAVWAPAALGGAVQVNAPSSSSQTAPAVDGNRVVWHDSSGDTIRTKNLATGAEETAYDSSESNLSPDVSGNRVIWNHNSTEIMSKDMGSGTISTIVRSIDSAPPGLAFLPGNPSISGDVVAWEDHRYLPSLDPGDIYGKTIGSSEYSVGRRGGTQNAPSVSGSNIVWSDGYYGDYDIRIRKSSTVSDVTGRITGDQTNPVISGNFCAWQDKRDSTRDIYVKNISSSSNPQTLIARDRSTYLKTAAGFGATSLNVNSTTGFEAGDRLYLSATGKSEWVTVASVSGSNTLNLQTGISEDTGFGSYTSVAGLWEQTNPAIYSDGSTYKLVWQDNRKDAGVPNPTYDIYMYDSATGLTKPVVVVPISNQVGPDISGSNIVWQDNRNGNWDIFMLAPPPIVTDDGAWTASTTSLHASWTYPGTATEYQYAIGTTAGGTNVRGWTSVGTNTEVTASGLSLSNGQTYYVSVKVLDGGSWTDPGTSNGIRVDSASPSVPGGVSASGGDGTAHVAWSASSDALSGVDHYNIYRAAVEGGPYSPIGSSTSPSYDDGVLTNGTTYWYQTRAVDGVGNESGPSTAVSATPRAPAPTVTDDGAWTTSTNALHASWTSVPAATSYDYAIGSTPGGTDALSWTDAGAATEITATGLSLGSGTTYYVSVRARAGGNVSSNAGTSNGILVDTQSPSAPGNVSAAAGNGTAHVTWSASIDPLSGVDHYDVYRSESEGGPYSPIGTSTSLICDDSGLTNGTTYWYQIRATDRLGNESDPSAAASATPKAPAPTVTDDGTWTVNTTQLHAAWSTVTSATSYDYAIGTSSGGTQTADWTNTGDAGLEVTATGLTLDSGATYYISVRARNGGNVSSAAGTSNGILVDTTGPAAPTGLAVTAGDTSATLRWNAATDPTGIDHYVVYRSDDGGATYPTSFTTTNRTYPDTGLANGTTYFYKVGAVDGAGNEGTASQEVSVTPNQAQTTLTIVRNAPLVVYGRYLTLSGNLMSVDVTPAPIQTGAEKILIQQRIAGGAWQTLTANVGTNASGHYNYWFKPSYNASYRAVWAGDGSHEGATSGVVASTVKPVVPIAASSYRIPRGASTRFFGTISPTRRYKTIVIQVKSGGVWKTLTSDATDWYSKYFARQVFRYRGTYYVRAYFPADSLNTAAYSRYIKIVVY